MTGKPVSSLHKHMLPKWWFAVFFLSLFFLPGHSLAQKTNDPETDEISVSVDIRGVGSLEMPAIIRGSDVLLPINSVFDFLKIKSSFTHAFDTLSGFYVNQQDVFLIDAVHDKITFKDTTTNIPPNDFIKEESNLYVNIKYLKTIFGLTGSFNFRTLTVTFTSNIELPAVREARQEMMRKNINRLNGDIKADTTIKRTYPNLHFGTADWSVTSTQQSIGPDATRLTLGLGGVVAGGETDASLTYFAGSPWDDKQQYYQWRYVNNDNSLVKQFMAGNIYTQSISSLYAPVVGIQFTNAPTTYRKAYGTYTLSNHTEPNWIVELYVNSVLVDYKKADATGFYTFDVPLVYGYSIIKLRFFGPYGEERTTQTYINIPFNFLPIHQFEYVASAGVVEDGRNSIFSRVGLNYGLTGSITVGGGVEYLSSITSGTTIPFLNASFKIAQNLLLSGEYDFGVRTIGILSYRFLKSIQLDLNYTKYNEGQTAIYYNYLDERKATLSMPIHNTNFMTLFSRLTVDEITVPNAKYTNAEWTFTGTVKSVGLNFSNYASFVQQSSPYLYGLASATFPLPKKIIFTAQLQYDYKQNKPIFMKYTAEKHLFGSGYLSLSYQEFFNNSSNIEQSTGNYQNILVGLRYDFAFTRVAMTALVDNDKGYSIVESASGSLIVNKQSSYINANNRTNVGKAGIVIEPFLDINCNGVRDQGEPRVPGVKLTVNGGRIIYDEGDTVIRILDLEAYINYYVTLNTNALDNIAWQIKNKVLKVAVSPNDLNVIEVPVSVLGEASGMVYLVEKEGGPQKGERQMTVNIYDSNSNRVAQTTTESDGFFSYIGLHPGDYTAQIDPVQLGRLHLVPKQAILPIHISQNRDGDIVDGLVFTLHANMEDTTKNNNITKQNVVAINNPQNNPNVDSAINNLPAGQKTPVTEKTANPITKSTEPQVHQNGIQTAKGKDSFIVIKEKISPVHSSYHVPFRTIALDIAKLYQGSVVCMLNDDNDIVDLQEINSNGDFLMYDYVPCHVQLPNKNKGIISQTIFLNDDLEIIEIINKRRVNGRYEYSR